MELKSSFDYKSLRKRQSKALKFYNRVGKGIENLGLNAADKQTISDILLKNFDFVMKEISEGREVAGVTDTGSKKDEAPAANAEAPADKAFV